MTADGPKCMDLLLEMRPSDILLLFTCFPYIMRDHRRGFLLLFDTADNKTQVPPVHNQMGLGFFYPQSLSSHA